MHYSTEHGVAATESFLSGGKLKYFTATACNTRRPKRKMGCYDYVSVANVMDIRHKKKVMTGRGKQCSSCVLVACVCVYAL